MAKRTIDFECQHQHKKKIKKNYKKKSKNQKSGCHAFIDHL